MSTPHPIGATGFWTLRRVADAVGHLAKVNLPSDDRPIPHVSTDTRTVQQGDLFVALKGESFDAHDFVKDAVAKGAGAVMVSRPMADLGVPVIEVPDTLAALGALGRYRRRAWNGPVVAVAGSNGKTSTKELIRAALGARLRVHHTTGNLNNLVGVPLTLLALPDDAEVAVVEMGTNQPGEVAALRQIIEPTVAVITSVGEEHLEGLGDVAGVLREELSVTDGVPVVITPASQPEIGQGARGRAKRVAEAGLEAGDLRASGWTVQRDGTGHMTVEGIEVPVPLRGAHNLRNAMLALAVAREMGIAIEDAARGISAMSPPPMRVNWEEIGSATLINDAYNANPPSTRAAIELLTHAGAGRQRVAILGTMRELGTHERSLHEDVARAALASPIELIGGVGAFGTALQALAPNDARVVTGADPAAVWSGLVPRIARNAVILLKGSRGVRLEQLVPGIEQWAKSENATIVNAQ
jgi:UDP-N-acetylmuramoyl-tripeptide--D-alanyl-D-alanine ligase